MTDPAIVVTGLRKHYGRITAVDGVDFTIDRGATCALLGANGAGKTTTVAMLLGLVTPTAGRISIFGEDLLADRYRVLPRMNFSSPYVDLPQSLTVRENLTVYARLYGIRAAGDRLRRLGADLDIDGLLDRKYRSLSAGQKTRVTLAKALLNEPELVLLDEPTASLDPDNADRVRSYLRAYQQRSGATLLMTSHNMTEIERVCTQVIIMRAGRIVDRGTPAELVTRYGLATMEEVFLDIARNGGDAMRECG